ncbi:hypothetical protein H0X48_01245 [Candidatus Dependentiae bacterium]|nr:hypothetical protein [Candidatus Dependentiae bacterium]
MKQIPTLLILVTCFIVYLSADSVITQEARANKPSAEELEDQDVACCPKPFIKRESICICMPSTGRPLLSRPLEYTRVAFKPYGYIKLDAFYDTRQIIGDREEHFLLFPAPYFPDVLGKDINAHGQYHMNAIETRAGVNIEGPQWGPCVIDGGIEADFRGSSEVSVNCFRMRLAYGFVDWKSGRFLFGEFSHPLYITDCYPDTVSFNGGAPLDPQARMPQLRVVQRWNQSELLVAVSSQRGFNSPGPKGLNAEYIARSKRPDLTAGLRYYFGDNFVGFVVDHKWLTPRLVSETGYKVDEILGSTIAEVYGSYRYAPVSLRAKSFYAQNGAEQILISGYGVSTRDEITDKRTYANTVAVGGWLDASYIFYCNRMELGFFAGYTKNKGSSKSLYIDPKSDEPIIYSLVPGVSNKIDSVARFSPRWVWSLDPLRIGVEVEWTRAAFGTPNKFGRICNARPVDNVRILGAFYYVF